MNEMRPTQPGPDFRSDNVGAVAPEIIEALARANRDTATGYDFAASKQAWSRPGRLDNATFGTGGAVLDIPSTTRAGGVGLGLYVVNQIIALHGGSIEVTSREGEGTTFAIVFPLAPATPDTHTNEPNPHSQELAA